MTIWEEIQRRCPICEKRPIVWLMYLSGIALQVCRLCARKRKRERAALRRKG